MNNIEQILNEFKSSIRYELYKELKNKEEEELKHNHPPMTKKVEGCKYCMKYGNVFESYKLEEEDNLFKITN